MTVTRKQCEELVERLATKSWEYCECGGYGNDGKCKSCKLVNDPVRIGDVLEKVPVDIMKSFTVCRLWEPCGFTKSLQELLNEAEWKRGAIAHVVFTLGDKPPTITDVPDYIEDCPTEKLFSYLIELGL